MPIIYASAVPGFTEIDEANVPVYENAIGEDNLIFNKIDLDTNHFPIFPDPVNVVFFDIGKRKESALIPNQPISINDIVLDASPKWLQPVPVPTGNNTLGNGIVANYPATTSFTFPDNGYKYVPTYTWGDALGSNDTADGIIWTNHGGIFYENRFLCDTPLHWVHHEVFYEMGPIPNVPGDTGWLKKAKLVIPEDVFYSDGGPRNNGWTYINNTVTCNLNYGVTNAATYYSKDLNNTNWKHGSIEFTIKPDKQNCVILSGIQGARKPFLNQAIPNGLGGTDYVQRPVGEEIGTQDTQAISTSVYTIKTKEGVEVGTVSGPSFYFTHAGSLTKFFKVTLENGKVTVVYDVPYGPNKKYVKLQAQTNIVDGNWHHVVINRPNKDIQRFPGIKYGGNGCIEIYIDGILQAKSDEISLKDSMPVPKLLFNDEGSTAWMEKAYVKGGINMPKGTYGERLKALQWVRNATQVTNYVGGISDYIFRQSYPLNPQEVNLNYTYAMMPDGTKYLKAAKSTASATMVMPTVSSNKPKVLKLYWNSLLKDKEKMKNGLEFENDTFDVYTYSVSHKNIVNQSKTFNIDKINDENETPFFLTNVRVAAKEHVFIFAPGMIPSQSESGQPTPIVVDWRVGNRLAMGDIEDNAWVARYGINDNASFNVVNIQIGGVTLVPGDRLLILDNPNKNENGVWEYTGPKTPLLRVEDATINNLKNAYVYVEEGLYAGTTWVQTEKVNDLRKSKQTWVEVNKEVYVSKPGSFPIHTTTWKNSIGDQKFINVNTDVLEDYDIIAFMNYPDTTNEIYEVIDSDSPAILDAVYKEFINNLKTAVNNGKKLYVSSPMLALDLGIVTQYVTVPQMLNENGDAQSAAISPFESAEPASSYYHTHRNMKYHLVQTIAGLTNKPTYIMTDVVTHSPNKTDSDYHIKYTYRQNGLIADDEFYIPGLTIIPESINQQFPGYLYNQKQTKDLVVFPDNKILLGTPVTKLSNTIYNNSTTATSNPYDDYITSIAVTYGAGKMFVNCVEDGYAFSRSDYNKGRIQNVTAGQSGETIATAAWQYSTKRLNRKNLYDFSENANLIGQTMPADGGGGPIVQAQTHSSNGVIRKNTNKDDLSYYSDIYTDFTEEYFTTTEIPVLSMTWLGLQWLAE